MHAYIRTYVCMYVRTRTHTQLHTHTLTHTHTRTRTRTRTRTHTHTHTHTHIYIYAGTRTHTQPNKQNTFTYLCDVCVFNSLIVYTKYRQRGWMLLLEVYTVIARTCLSGIYSIYPMKYSASLQSWLSYVCALRLKCKTLMQS